MVESIDTPCRSYKEQQEKNDWELITDLLGGTRAMREAGTKWLPQESGETTEQYNNRLKRTFLYNGFERCILKNTGKIFSTPVLLGAKTDPDILKWMEDIDLAGQRITPFFQSVYQTCSAFGLCHVLVDYPQSAAKTLADKKTMGHRPYAIKIPPADLIYYEHERVNGVITLREIRFLQKISVNEDGTQEEKTDVVVFRPDQYERYRKNKNQTFDRIESGTLSLGKIPLVTIYFNRTGLMSAQPPYLTLTYLNLAHWQSYSDYRNYLRLCGMPTPCFAGFGTGDSAEVPIGPNIARETDNVDAKAWYMEVATGSDNALRNGLQLLEQQMEIMGTALTMGTSWQMTATEKVINTVEGDNFVSMSARTLQYGVQQVLELMAEWEKKDPKTAIENVQVNDDFGLLFGGEGELAEWSKARDRGDISQKTYLEGLKKRGMLDEDHDIEAEIEASRLERDRNLSLSPESLEFGEE
jgi:hypothetical protein